jgi:UDP-GlcNAc:undecaprenyl-phosphate GlcNAc-1-phosphate transferase
MDGRVEIASLLLAFFAAAVVAAAATPVVSRLARMLQIVDQPGARKVNLRPDIPLLGGIAVALGFFVGLSLVVIQTGDAVRYRDHMEALLLGGILLLGLGAWDDRFALSAWPKFAVQFAAAGIAIFYGFRIDHFTDPITHGQLTLPTWLMVAVTTLWIVGITNAMNLIDGLDGLCTGVGAIIGITLTVVCWQGGHVPGVYFGAALVGGLLGFLPFNFSPARIFLGDTGALFIGYLLSLLALEGYRSLSVLTFLVPLLALAVPLLDTTLSVLRRIRRRSNPFGADRAHMHHRLLQFQGSQRGAVLSIYFLTACFCVIALSFTELRGSVSIVVVLVVGLLTVRLLRNLGFFEVEPNEAAATQPDAGEVGGRRG